MTSAVMSTSFSVNDEWCSGAFAYMLQYIMLGFTVVFQGVAKGENREGLFVLLCGSGPGAAFIYGYNNKEEISNGCLRLFYRVPALESVPMASPDG